MVESARAPQPTARRNRLALVSVFLALVFPVGIFCALVGTGVIAHNIAFTTLWSLAGAALLLAGLPAMALAIVAGHAALRRADRQPFQRPLRGVARLGLALGYGSLAAALGLVGLAIWVMVHGVRMHLVY